MCRQKNFVHKFSLPIRIFHLGFIQFIILFMFLILIPGHIIQCYETYDEFDQLAEESSITSLASPIIDISTTTIVPAASPLIINSDDDKIYKKKFNPTSSKVSSSSSLNALTFSKSNKFGTKNSKNVNKPFSLFSCQNKSEGYYADIKFCDIFHYCKVNNKRYTFVCPVNSYYNSESLICEHYNLTLTLKNRNCVRAKISDVERYKFNGEIDDKTKVNKELFLSLVNPNNNNNNDNNDDDDDDHYDGILSAQNTEASKNIPETTLKSNHLKQLSPQQQQTSQSSTLIANFLDPPTVATTTLDSSSTIKSLILMANHVDPHQQQKQKQSKQLHLMNNQTIVASTAAALRQQKQKEKLKKIRALEKQFHNWKLNPASTTTLIPPSLFSEPIDIVPDLANDGTQPHLKYPKHEFIINHLQTTTTTTSTPTTTATLQLLTTPSSTINQNPTNKMDIINKIKKDNNEIELMNKEKFSLNNNNNNNNEEKNDSTTTTTCRPMVKQSISPTTMKRLVQPPLRAANVVFNRNDVHQASHHLYPHPPQHSQVLLSTKFTENNGSQKTKTKEFKFKKNNLTFIDYGKEQIQQHPQRAIQQINKHSYPPFWYNNNGANSNGIKSDLLNNQFYLNSKNQFKMNDDFIRLLLQQTTINNDTIYKSKHLSIENGDELFDNDDSYSMLPLSASSQNENGNNGKFTLSIHKFIRESLPTQYLKSVPRFFKNFIYNNNNNNNNNFFADPGNKLKQEHHQQGPNNDKLNHDTIMAFVEKDNEGSDIDLDNMDTVVNGADDGGKENNALAEAMALTTFTMFDNGKLQSDSKKFDANKINYRNYNYNYPSPQATNDYYIDQMSTINSDNKNNGEQTQKLRQKNSMDLLLNNINHNNKHKDNTDNNNNNNKHVNPDTDDRTISSLTTAIDDDDDVDDDDDKISMLNIPVLVPTHLKQDDYRQHMSESLLRPIVIPLKEKDKLLVPAYVLELNNNEHVRLKRSSSSTSLSSLGENILNHNNKDHLTAKKLLKFPIKTNLLSNFLPTALKNKLLKSTKLANSINNHNENAVKSTLEQVQSSTGSMQNTINTIPLYFPTSEYESYLNLFKTDNNNNNIYDLKEFSNHFLSPYYFSNVDTTPAYYSSSSSTSASSSSPGHKSKSSSMLFSSSTNLAKHFPQHKVNHNGKTSNRTTYNGSLMSQHYPSAFMPSLAFPFSYPFMNQINYTPTKQNELIKNGKYGQMSKNVASSTSAETGTSTNVQKIPAPSSANIYVPDELFEDFQVFKPTKAISESVAKVAVGSTKSPLFTSKLTELNEPNESNLLITYTGIKDALNRYNGRINKKIDTLSSSEESLADLPSTTTISTTTSNSASTTTINTSSKEHSNNYQIIDHNKNMFIINYSNGSTLRIAGKKMKDLNLNDLTGKKDRDLSKIMSAASTVRATMLVAPGIHVSSFTNKNDDIKRTTDPTPSNTFTARSFTLEPSSDYFSPKTLLMGTINNNGRKSSLPKASKNPFTN